MLFFVLGPFLVVPRINAGSHSGVTPEMLRISYGIVGIEPWSASRKANILPTGLPF